MIYKINAREDVFVEADNDKELMFGLMLLTEQNSDVLEWMEGIARRCHVDSLAEIRTDNIENFINDLINHGYITKQEIH